jgi:hypothetical protein
MDPQPAPWSASLPFTTERIGAVAIYCSDGRFGEQFDEFLHQRLGLPRYDRLAIPGGAAALGGHISAHREQEALVEQLRFLIDSHDLQRVVLIAHRNCGFYLRKLHCGESGLRQKQEQDLARAAEAIRAMGRHLLVEAFFASAEGGAVVLEPVPVEAAEPR